jgi:hypothetical protein
MPVLRDVAIVVFGLAVLAGLDQAFDDGRYAEPALEMLRQISRSFGF